MYSLKLGTRWIVSLGTLALAAGCGAGTELPLDQENADIGQSEIGQSNDLSQGDLGQGEQALTSCGGDDSNSLAASLAVAIAKELGRWDVNTDFVVSNGKLELSATGNLHCGSGCGNVKALLRMQDDASSVVPNHSPATYRNNLTTWYAQQQTALTNLVTQLLTKDEGIYQIRSQLSGKYIVPQYGSTSNGAALTQSDQYTYTTASQWRVMLKGVHRQLINIKSGMCMDLQSNTSSSTNIVQRPCNGSSTQNFRLGQLNPGILTIRSDYNQAFVPKSSSTSNNANIVQSTVTGATPEQWVFVPYGGGTHLDLLETATAVYSLKVAHTGYGLAVATSSLNDGVGVVQQPYNASDDRFHWYVTQLGSWTSPSGVVQTTYQFMNRRTGKCLDLDGSYPKHLIQRTCSTSYTQRFGMSPTGNLRQVMYTSNGLTVDVQNGSTSSGAPVVEGSSGEGWQFYNMITFDPILAIEPHRLSYAYSTTNGPCGSYDWYNITQPNGLALKNPASTYIELIFAGGKQTPSGTDLNPYIAQQVSGSQVAIDPSAYMTSGSTSTSGSCIAASVLYDPSRAYVGKCCIKLTGAYAKFVTSSWSTTTDLCY